MKRMTTMDLRTSDTSAKIVDGAAISDRSAKMERSPSLTSSQKKEIQEKITLHKKDVLEN